MSCIYDAIHCYLGSFILQSSSRVPDSQDMELYRKELHTLRGREVFIPSDDGIRLKAAHFIGKGCTERSPTVVLCNGSAPHFEEYVAKKHFHVSKWLERGVNVFLFNYRGIGTEKQGKISRVALRNDVGTVVNHVKTVYKVLEDKIALDAHSLSALPASDFAKDARISFCADRTFFELTRVIEEQHNDGYFEMFFVKICAIIARFFGWQASVIENWEQIKGKKWIVHVDRDTVLPKKTRLMTQFQNKQPQPIVINMEIGSTPRENHRKALSDSELDQFIALMKSKTTV
jgi:hypothetical protein